MEFLLFLLLVSTVSAGYRPGYRKQGGNGVFLVSGNKTEIRKALSTCLTPGCVKSAATVLEMIDLKVDPCNNFYDFACGNFIKETTIPDHKSETGPFSMMEDKLIQRLRKLFESIPVANEPKIFESVRNYYKSCMDQVFSAKANQKGPKIGRILEFKIGVNLEDVNIRMISATSPTPVLSPEFLINGLKNKNVQAYFRYMVDIAVYLGAKKEIAEKELKESLLFEIKLAEMMSVPEEQSRNATVFNNQMTIKEANKLFPGFNWTSHINNIFPNLETPLQSYEVINVEVPIYVKRIAEYLHTVPTRVQANYLIWRIINDLVLYGDKTMQQIDLKFKNILTGESLASPRWEICTKAIAGLSDGYDYFFMEGTQLNAVGAMYAKEYFPESSKNIVNDMVTNIKKEFKIMLDELDWIDDITRKKAHVKVDKMTPHVGYAKEILDNNLINEFYEGLELASPDFLTNNLILKSFVKKYLSQIYRKPMDHKSWKIHGGAAFPNAFFEENQNSIILPAAVFTGLFFQADRPKYMNYGAIGSVIGHEITHGFDDQGSQSDDNGNLVNWWDLDTKQKFLDKTQCIIDQYGNYTVDINGTVFNLDGINAQGENIADNGGIKQAYRAYERLMKKEGKEQFLPGLQYTPRQLFWISVASLQCNAIRDKQLLNIVLTGTHTLSRFRVNGPLSNQKEFSKDWNCPPGSPMNPTKKCSVW
ncbi:neprilysin-2 [Eurytemora carolleeae]|uniref:neprilysin-2 n=1 Tax=Eurytemora carolleeae TaxID=1294199 RepID=UPI000C759E5C|nr:neprilysin-2 [Eurytemora carolleeae]|eukprot:XP_023334270.1 neprilysin-2-like [Eurytemora affinis]